MAKKPKKIVVQNIVKNLVDSEIPGIQAVVKELAEWTKQLEEHSWKIQHYASEIEALSKEEESESPEEASLAELVKDLEKTLGQLRQGTVDTTAISPGITKAEEEMKDVLAEVEAETEEEVVEHEDETEIESKVDVVDEKPLEEEGRKKTAETKPEVETYTTPEGFIVKRVRR